jgi:hypothetical protein
MRNRLIANIYAIVRLRKCFAKNFLKILFFEVGGSVFEGWEIKKVSECDTLGIYQEISLQSP